MIDTERYGGRRAYFAHLMARAKSVMGTYSHLMAVEWSSVERLVFICKGNICRSPYAATRARALGIDAISFGLEAINDAAADPNATRNASQRQLDLSSHRSSKLCASKIRSTDLVLFFEPGHLAAYRDISANHPVAVSLLGLWTEPKRPYICDPFGKSDRYFQECFSLIDTGVANLLAHAVHKS